ncbi:hypothetical protein ADK55_26785 [Streptomyces sp. WM4235]|uniref:hypothetical protein n=1 Tax=Streptomyces sp. WM4235 TaxID=1415551 RepID=UPI0006B0427C|nr:hypothetical protein [Streptomyces sp. WM4235]KOU42065.1 hypothetical protein ADK55_26785 [Streptomyces sp. WM4235]
MERALRAAGTPGERAFAHTHLASLALDSGDPATALRQAQAGLVVLLGAVALGRTAFGVLPVIGYGLGMATTLTLAGLLLMRLRDRITARTAERASARLQTLGRIGPAATSALVLLVGLGLTTRAITGL